MKKTALSLLIASLLSSSNLANANNEPDYVFEFLNTKGLFQPLDLTPEFNENGGFSAENGSLTFRLKNSTTFSTFFGAANPNSATEYLSLYSQSKNGKDTFGLEIRKGSNLIHNDKLKIEIPKSTSEYRNVTYTFNKESGEINIYVDGKKEHTHREGSKFFKDISGLKNAFLGKTGRSTQGNNKSWHYLGDIYYADFDKNVLTDQEIAEKHNALNYLEYKREPLGAIKTTPENLFTPGQENSRNYRIPSLLTTKNGTVIAAIDKRNQHSADWGNIDTVIRRSLDNGKTWESDQVIIDLVSQPYVRGTKNSAFLIDPLMVQDKRSGRIFMLLDMFPEMQGLFNFPNHGEGTGYKKINGKHYRLLKDEDGNHYTVREEGIVYNEENKPTNYRVVIEGTQSIAYKDLGDLYQGDQKLGNIFLNTDNPGLDNRGNSLSHPNDGPTGKAPLTAKKTSYLWLTHSDDDGVTWSNPIDITPQVKEDWMKFLGVGPGTGIQLKDGTLIMPVYYTNNLHNHLSSQSAAVIISKDGGATWERGESPMDRWAYDNDGTRELNNGLETTESQVIELDNGDLKMFSRNKLSTKVIISTSKDKGYTWQKTYQEDDILLEPYSQLSVIKYSKKINGKEIVLFANPFSHPVDPERAPGRGPRVNGRVWMGEVQEDGTIKWKYNTTITTDSYAYNSLTELPDGRIGLMYESGSDIKYIAFNLQELVWHDNYIYRDKRDQETPKDVRLDSFYEETFYKIGDGEMVKLGEGVNPAHLVIQEGSALLNQSANADNGQKQAYASVVVQENATVRLGSADQVPLNQLYLNNATLDLNGQEITVSAADQLTQAVEQPNQANPQAIMGNIVNENPDAEATLNYTVGGRDRFIVGNVGNEKGKLNLTYSPIEAESGLSIAGNSVLNVVDVKSGGVAYTINPQNQHTQHSVKTLKVADNAFFGTDSNTTTTIENAHLAGTNSNVAFLANENEKNQITVNTAGTGNFTTGGAGLVELSGNLNHNGKTDFASGKVEFNGTLANSTLVVNTGTTLGGNATITGDTTLKQGSVISLGFNQPAGEFGAKVMQFANVVNEGARVLLRVNNADENSATWKHDQLIITGQLQTENAIPVDVQLLDTVEGNTDTNNNGKYDVDEGLSLIKVAAESNKLQQFVFGNTITRARSNGLFQNELVSVDAAASNQEANDGTKFYDYRLQTKLVDAQGNSPEAVIRSLEQVGTPEIIDLPTVSDEEIAKILLEQKVEKAEADKAAAEQKAQQAQTDKAAAEQQAQQAQTDKAKAEEALRNLKAEKAAENAQKQQQMDNAAKQYRAALHQKVPSYLVANTAMLNQGETVRRQFMGNIWADDKKGFYVNQQNGNSTYRSNLGFTDYGYGYKANQSSTLFGGFAPLSGNTELHAAVGFGKQSVKPQAVDGASETRYKSTSFLVGLHNKWDNVIFNTVLGYHLHRGKVSTSSEKNIARIEGTQVQFAGEVGYEIPVGQFAITPIFGLSYNQLRTDVEDSQDRWNVALKPYNVFSQQVGTQLSWKNDVVKLSAGAFYENSNGKPKAVSVSAGSQQAEFITGRQGNALLLNVNSDFTIAKQFSLGLRLEHRHGLSKAELKQTQFSGKLEYKF